jgi:hypothetical protein
MTANQRWFVEERGLLLRDCGITINYNICLQNDEFFMEDTAENTKHLGNMY